MIMTGPGELAHTMRSTDRWGNERMAELPAGDRTGLPARRYGILAEAVPELAAHARRPPPRGRSPVG